MCRNLEHCGLDADYTDWSGLPPIEISLILSAPIRTVRVIRVQILDRRVEIMRKPWTLRFGRGLHRLERITTDRKIANLIRANPHHPRNPRPNPRSSSGDYPETLDTAVWTRITPIGADYHR